MKVSDVIRTSIIKYLIETPAVPARCERTPFPSETKVPVTDAKVALIGTEAPEPERPCSEVVLCQPSLDGPH
jgi:hypothetical protein